MMRITCTPFPSFPSPSPSPPVQVKEEGFEVAHDGYTITIFSAPNYCDQMVRLDSWLHGRHSKAGQPCAALRLRAGGR